MGGIQVLLFLYLLQVWDDIISQASKNVDILKEIDVVKQLASILKTNVRACKALNHAYVLQLGRIYLDMLNVYKVSFVFFFFIYCRYKFCASNQ